MNHTNTDTTQILSSAEKATTTDDNRIYTLDQPQGIVNGTNYATGMSLSSKSLEQLVGAPSYIEDIVINLVDESTETTVCTKTLKTHGIYYDAIYKKHIISFTTSDFSSEGLQTGRYYKVKDCSATHISGDVIEFSLSGKIRFV